MSEWRGDVGIDIGKRRIAYGWPAYRLAGYVDLGKTGTRRDGELRIMQAWLTRFIPVGVQLWVDQSFAGGGGTPIAQSLSETISAVFTAQDWTLEPILVHQATWKSQVIGNHMADKKEINAWLLQNYPDHHAKCSTEDEVDAMVIGLYGQGRTEGRILAPEPRRKPRR